MRERRRFGVRLRVTALATAVVALALVAGAVGVWLTAQASLYGGLRAAAEQDAELLATGIQAGGMPDLSDADDERFVQIVVGGRVVARTNGAPDVPVLTDRVAVADEQYPLVSRRLGDVTVIAGRASSDADETLEALARLLALGIPVLVALVAAVTWLAVGRALAPVDKMRRQVDDISAATLTRRIDEPRTGDEIGRLATTLNGMLDRLDRSQEAQRRFISDASHELKSPLASLRQFAEVASMHPDRVSRDELVEAVLDEGARLNRLVEGMLVLARTDEHALSTAARTVDMDDALLVEARRLRALHQGVTIDVSGIRHARVQGDPDLLGQLVRNLAENAARHARGRIALTTRTEPAREGGGAVVVLAISDDGEGVPEADRERVFDRFVRLDAARSRAAGGSGLGLAIVAEIARVHGGAVRMTSDPRLGGALVEVTLPAASDVPSGVQAGFSDGAGQ